MPIGKVVQVALPDRQGVIVVNEQGVDAMYRYSRTPDVVLEVGDYVRGEIYGFSFAVLYLVRGEPADVFFVDFVERKLKGVSYGKDSDRNLGSAGPFGSVALPRTEQE